MEALKKLTIDRKERSFDETISIVAILSSRQTRASYLVNMKTIIPVREKILVIGADNEAANFDSKIFECLSKDKKIKTGKYRFGFPLQMKDKELNKFINMRFIPSNYKEFIDRMHENNISIIYMNEKYASTVIGRLSDEESALKENILIFYNFISRFTSISKIFISSTQSRSSFTINIEQLKNSDDKSK